MVTTVQTEEVCDECGSTNIGYDALVKNIGGKLEVVGGPYDSCQCINEYCQNLEPHVRNVPVQDLRDCDGKDCYYNGDKGVMKEVRSTVLNESYWYCSNCTRALGRRISAYLDNDGKPCREEEVS